jgi:hypothetical protein
VCSLDVYECRYKVAEESPEEKKSNVGPIVGGALGGLVFLVALVFAGYRCCRKRDLDEVRARARRPNAPAQQPDLHKPYGKTTYRNPAYNVATLEDTYAEIAEDPAYEQSDPNRPGLYDKGFLPGARDHALRDKRLSQQLEGVDVDI